MPDFTTARGGCAVSQTLFQMAGSSLSVVGTVLPQLEATAKARAAEIAALPRLRGAVEAGATKLKIKVLSDKPLPGGKTVVVRLRPTADAELQDYRAWHAAQDGTVEVERHRIAMDSVCCKPG
jgi:imidazolonepropionase-like amidohydrolase